MAASLRSSGSAAAAELLAATGDVPVAGADGSRSPSPVMLRRHSVAAIAAAHAASASASAAASPADRSLRPPPPPQLPQQPQQPQPQRFAFAQQLLVRPRLFVRVGLLNFYYFRFGVGEKTMRYG